MKDSMIKFQLIDLNRVKGLVFTSVPRPNELKFNLFKEGEKPVRLKVIKSTSMNYISIFELALPAPFEFGKEHAINLSHFSTQPIDVSDATTFKEFDEMFNYYGDDLGATYHKDHTDFALWAPLATRVTLKIQEGDSYKFYDLKRGQKGVYRITLQGDYLNAKYLYLVTNSGVTLETTDPYGKGASENSHYSGVVDLEYIKHLGNIKPKTEIKNYVDSVIYEVGIRDFTEQEGTTDIVNKGKYLGFIEEGRKTKGGNPAGLDYLKCLGITHVQLNPVIDFGTVDDLNVSLKYNWGYDPISMFAIEGSYSIRPDVPMERLIEFKTMVNKLHENDIRVIIDVVYNHIYEHVSSQFEKVVPNYFFRRTTVGLTSNASGCGDDVASERFMVRKMINDSLKYFVEVFDVDGYRFDLMGLLDIETVKTGFVMCKDIKEDVMMYGEGWNMGAELPYEKKACTDNAFKLPEFGFFNDTARDVIKGPTFRDAITQKGYINGDTNYGYGLKFILFGSCLNVNYNARFLDANQSINYAECHDNNTLFDKLEFSNNDEELEVILKRIQLANALIATIFGVPFYHMGQEIGLSKNGNDNTYNVLDINKMDWSLIDERFLMVKHFKEVIAFRKSMPLYHLHTREELKDVVECFEAEGLFFYRCNKKEYLNGAESMTVIYNPTTKSVPFEFEQDHLFVFGNLGRAEKDDMLFRNIVIPPTNCAVFIKK